MGKKWFKQHHPSEQSPEAPVAEQETSVESVPVTPLPFPGNPATHRPGASGVHGDPFPERATLVPDIDIPLQQTELAANPVPTQRLVPRYYDGPAGS